MGTSRSTESRAGAGISAGPRLLWLVATVLVVLVAGCGGKSRLTKPEYEQRVRAAYARVQSAFLATDVESTQVLARRVAAAQAALRAAAARLDETAPPSDVEVPNHQLVTGMLEYARELTPLRTAAARGDRPAVDRLRIPKGPTEAGETESANAAVERMAEAVEAMTRAGYDLGRIAKE